jgi:hypothetical protein
MNFSRQKAAKEAVNNHKKKKSFSNIALIAHKLNRLGGI